MTEPNFFADDAPQDLRHSETNSVDESNITPILTRMVEQVAEEYLNRQIHDDHVAPARFPQGPQLARLSDVPNFSGDPSDKMTFDEWKTIFDRIAKANMWSDARKLDLVPLKFCDAALKVSSF